MNEIPYHTHNNTDTPKLNTEFLQFPVVSTAPTDSPPNGTIRIHFDGSTTYKIYVRVNNAWKSATLS